MDAPRTAPEARLIRLRLARLSGAGSLGLVLVCTDLAFENLIEGGGVLDMTERQNCLWKGDIGN
jgi:hypothetical protein